MYGSYLTFLKYSLEKNISADEADVKKQEIKGLVAVCYNAL